MSRRDRPREHRERREREHRDRDGRDHHRDRDGKKHHDPVDEIFDDLMHAIKSTKTNFMPLPGYSKTNKGHLEDRMAAGLDCDEVYPCIYVGDAGTARNKQYLQRIGVTHVLNCAEGLHIGQVNTGPSFYEGCPIQYLGLDLMDFPISNISKFFQPAAEFIASAINEKGRVLVHCLMGMSRSSACVVAYLMLHKGNSACQAIRTLRTKRDVRPNPGFLRQLATLELDLRSGK